MFPNEKMNVAERNCSSFFVVNYSKLFTISILSLFPPKCKVLSPLKLGPNPSILTRQKISSLSPHQPRQLLRLLLTHQLAKPLLIQEIMIHVLKAWYDRL
jgi:hypothetical protein